MYEGSLVLAGWEALITMQQLVILADIDGVVDMTPKAISSTTGIPLRHIRRGLVALEKPDPDSRTPDEEGRRIVRVTSTRSWGWRIVNYAHYRKIRSQEERREYQRNLMRDRRAEAKAKQNGGPVSDVSPALAAVSNVSPSSKKREKQKGEASRSKTTATEKPSPFPKSICDRLFETWISARGGIDYGAFRKALESLYPTQGPLFAEEQLVKAIAAHAEFVDGLTPKEAGFEDVRKFAQNVQRWVRIGSMPVVDPETRELTERGRLALA
jgi:hypothetical protein